MLTKKQQEVFDEMLDYIKRKEHYLLSSENRGIGKTFTLNELAFNLQALGYKVLILTPYQYQEYFADMFISLYPLSYSRLTNNTVIITDEARYEMMEDFLNYCDCRNVPVVGYVNFRISKPIEPIEFEKEYEYTWFSTEK